MMQWLSVGGEKWSLPLLWLVSMGFQGGFMVFHGFWLVSMVFQGGFMVFYGFHGFSRWFHVFSWFLVGFHGFHGFSSWFHGFSWFLAWIIANREINSSSIVKQQQCQTCKVSSADHHLYRAAGSKLHLPSAAMLRQQLVVAKAVPLILARSSAAPQLNLVGWVWGENHRISFFPIRSSGSEMNAKKM